MNSWDSESALSESDLSIRLIENCVVIAEEIQAQNPNISLPIRHNFDLAKRLRRIIPNIRFPRQEVFYIVNFKPQVWYLVVLALGARTLLNIPYRFKSNPQIL